MSIISSSILGGGNEGASGDGGGVQCQYSCLEEGKCKVEWTISSAYGSSAGSATCFPLRSVAALKKAQIVPMTYIKPVFMSSFGGECSNKGGNLPPSCADCHGGVQARGETCGDGNGKPDPPVGVGPGQPSCRYSCIEEGKCKVEWRLGGSAGSATCFPLR